MKPTIISIKETDWNSESLVFRRKAKGVPISGALLLYPYMQPPTVGPMVHDNKDSAIKKKSSPNEVSDWLVLDSDLNIVDESDDDVFQRNPRKRLRRLSDTPLKSHDQTRSEPVVRCKSCGRRVDASMTGESSAGSTLSDQTRSNHQQGAEECNEDIQQWSCSACTYLNLWNVNICEICGTQRSVELVTKSTETATSSILARLKAKKDVDVLQPAVHFLPSTSRSISSTVMYDKTDWRTDDFGDKFDVDAVGSGASHSSLIGNSRTTGASGVADQITRRSATRSDVIEIYDEADNIDGDSGIGAVSLSSSSVESCSENEEENISDFVDDDDEQIFRHDNLKADRQFSGGVVDNYGGQVEVRSSFFGDPDLGDVVTVRDILNTRGATTIDFKKFMLNNNSGKALNLKYENRKDSRTKKKTRSTKKGASAAKGGPPWAKKRRTK